MSAYSITEAAVRDPDAASRYAALASASVRHHGGRFLVRGEPTVQEGQWPAGTRLVIIEFPDMPTLRAWYDSPEYAPARSLAASALRRRIVFADGVES